MEETKSARTGRTGEESGFSLLEVMIGVSVLVGGLMGLGMAMVSSYNLDRSTTERKVALAFAAAKIERIRGLNYKDINVRPKLINANPADTTDYGGYLPELAWGTTSSGTSAAVGTAPGAGSVGFRYTLDGDADEDIFGMYYTRQNWISTSGGYFADQYVSMSGGWVIRTSDPQLNALTPISRFGGRLAQITFRDTDSATGLAEGSGYWVTVKVFWQGATGGEQEEKLCTFVAR